MGVVGSTALHSNGGNDGVRTQPKTVEIDLQDARNWLLEAGKGQ